MKNIRLNQKLLIVALFASMTVLQYCKSSQPVATASTANVPPVSYAADIAPIMERSCTPCHYPDQGKKELLHTLEATRKYADDIAKRVEKPVDAPGYMPFKSKKPAFTAEEIQMFKNWMAQGMPE